MSKPTNTQICSRHQKLERSSTDQHFNMLRFYVNKRTINFSVVTTFWQKVCL